MRSDIQLVYCAGKNRAFEAIALASGFRLGAQIPCTVYHPIYFADQDWKKPNRERYMAALKEHRPHMATVLDLERADQLREVLGWAEEAAAFTEHVLIIPKYSGAVDSLPRQIGGASVVLAYSVPTQFGGTEVPAWEFYDWPVHLLGGSPQKQMEIAKYLDVRSCDGNMAQLQANSCRFWSALPNAKGHWWQLRDIGDADRAPGARERAFRRSCENIMRAWRDL